MSLQSPCKQRCFTLGGLGILITIVAVSAISAVHAANHAGSLPPFRATAAHTAPTVSSLMVTVESSRGSGSGEIIGAAGYLVTTYHVAFGPGGGKHAASRYTVTLSTGTVRTATVAGIDVADDLVVLKFPTSGLPALPVAGLFSGRLVTDGAGEHVSALCLTCTAWLNSVIHPAGSDAGRLHGSRLRTQRAS